MIEQITFDLRDLIDYLEIDEEAKARIVVSTLEVEDDIVEVKELQGHVEGYGWDITIVKHDGIEGIRLYIHDIRDDRLIEAHSVIDIGDDINGERFDESIIAYTRSIQTDKVRIINDPAIEKVDRIKLLVENIVLTMYENKETDSIRMVRP